MAANVTTSPTEGAVHVSYGDRPSRAWLCSDTQFVLLKALWGAVRSRYIELAKDVLADAERLEQHINADRSDANARQDLKLRGIRFEEVHNSMVIHADLLYPRQVAAALTEQQICDAFYHAQAHYGGQLGMVVTITPVQASAAHYDPLADSCYEEVRQAISW